MQKYLQRAYASWRKFLICPYLIFEVVSLVSGAWHTGRLSSRRAMLEWLRFSVMHDLFGSFLVQYLGSFTSTQKSNFRASWSSFYVWFPDSLKRQVQYVKQFLYMLFNFKARVSLYINLFNFKGFDNIFRVTIGEQPLDVAGIVVLRDD